MHKPAACVSHNPLRSGVFFRHWNGKNNTHRRRHTGGPPCSRRRLLPARRPRGAPRRRSKRPARRRRRDVGVMDIKRADVPLTLAYAGRVAGFRDVEIRAKVCGTLMKREFAEGARVKQGDTLFRIDPRPYQAVLDRANAQLAQAEATARQAEENFNRIQELVEQAGRDPEAARRRARRPRPGARARSSRSRPRSRTRELNLEFTMVKAPVAGPTALLSPPEGSIVQAQQTVLTTITQLDPAYVNFSITDAECAVPRAQRQPREAAHRRRHHRRAAVRRRHAPIRRPARSSCRRTSVDLRTGTVQIRAVFPNAEGAHPAGPVRAPDHQGHHPAQGDRHSAAGGVAGPARHVRLCRRAASAAEVRPVKLGREVDNGWIVVRASTKATASSPTA